MDAVVTAGFHNFAPHSHRMQTDITHAWQAAQAQILAAGIELHRAPLFLTLGQPAGGIEEFCSLLPLESPFPLPSASDDAPLQVYGNQEGLFVCCKQTSVLGDYLNRLATAADDFPEPASSARLQIATGDSPATTAASTERNSGGAFGGILQTGSRADSCNHGPAREPQFSPLAEGPSGTTATLTGPLVAGPIVATRRVPCPSASETVRSIEFQLDELERQLALADAVLQPQPSAAAQDRPTAEVAGARFAQLCRLISAAREPYCPLNGVVILVPLEILDCDETAEQGGSCIQRDLQTVMRTLETEVSVQVVVCGLAACEGGDELLDRLSQDQLYGTFGFALPTPLGGNREAARRSIERASEWLCEGLFPALAYRVLRRDADDERSDRADLEGNRRLHALIGSLRGRRQRLSRLLVGSLSATSGQWRIRGCFFAPTANKSATGTPPANPLPANPLSASSLPARQAFTAGILGQIHGIQNEVRWLESRRRRDATAMAVALAGYVLIAATTLVSAALLLL